MSETVTMNEAADILGCCPRTVGYHTATGRLQARRQRAAPTNYTFLTYQRKDVERLAESLKAQRKLRSRHPTRTREILRLYKQGVRKSAIAKRLGVARMEIHRVLKNNGAEVRSEGNGEG